MPVQTCSLCDRQKEANDLWHVIGGGLDYWNCSDSDATCKAIRNEKEAFADAQRREAKAFLELDEIPKQPDLSKENKHKSRIRQRAWNVISAPFTCGSAAIRRYAGYEKIKLN